MSSPFWPLELPWLVHAQISRWRMNAALPWVSDPNSVPNPRYYRASSWAHSPGSSSLSKFGIFFFVLTLQWNPFIPHLAEDVKLFCQGSWMQGKLGWGFPCPELASTVCWSGLCRAVTMGVLIHHLEEPSVSGQTCNFRSQPAHDQLPWGHKDKPPESVGYSEDAAPTPVLLAVLFHSRKQSFLVPGGELPVWKSTLSQAGPALLPSSVHGQPALCPCPPALPRAVESLWSVQLFSNACTDEFLKFCSNRTVLVLWITWLSWSLLFCSDVLYNEWSVQVHMLHRPFGNWWSVFSRIRVIQTSCTCRLKRYNTPASCSHRSQCMSVAPQSHTWKFTDTEIHLHTLPCSLSASSALSAMKIHTKNWVSQCYFPHILLAAAHAFLAQNLAFHCYLLYSWSGFFLVLFMTSSVKIPVFLLFLIY